MQWHERTRPWRTDGGTCGGGVGTWHAVSGISGGETGDSRNETTTYTRNVQNSELAGPLPNNTLKKLAAAMRRARSRACAEVVTDVPTTLQHMHNRCQPRTE